MWGLPANLTRDLMRAIVGSLHRSPVTADRLAVRQAGRLQRLIRYAHRYSPYYRALFNERRLHPSDIRTSADLARFPILDRNLARERIDDLISTEVNPRSLLRRTTSGSSGAPFPFPETALERFASNLFWAQCYMDCGYRPLSRQVKIVLPSQMAQRRRPWERLGLFRRIYLDATLSPDEKIEWLRRLNPAFLVAWGHMLEEISWRLEETEDHLDVPRVCSTASALWPETRRRAERRMRARVFDLYGAVETGPVAWECGCHGGFHVHSDLVVLEIVDEEGRPARRGRLVCTVLWRRSLPLIRYAVGDTGEWSDNANNSCALPYPVLRALTGRETETICLPNGMRISPFTLRDALYDRSPDVQGQLTYKPGIAQFQMIQETPSAFRLRIVPGAGFSPEVERSVLDDFHRRFGRALQLRVVCVARIDSPPGVKFSPMISLEYIERMRMRGVNTDIFTREPCPSPSSRRGDHEAGAKRSR